MGAYICANVRVPTHPPPLFSLARVVFTHVADELAGLVIKDATTHALTAAVKLEAHQVVLAAPLPPDMRLCRLQGAVQGFTGWLAETSAA